MAERVKETLIEEHGVDFVAGPDSYLDLPNLVAAAETGNKAHERGPEPDRDIPRRDTLSHRPFAHQRVYQYNARVQQFLLLLHSALHTRAGALARTSEHIG